MKNIIGKSKIKSTNLPREHKISVISLQILLRNWSVKYQNPLKHLKHKSTN